MAITFKKLSGDTEVVANPELDGTETALSGLQIDGVKYVMGGRKSYQHLITVYYYKSSANILRTAKLTIINNSAEEFTFDSLLQWLYDNGHTTNSGKEYQATGVIREGAGDAQTYYSVYAVHTFNCKYLGFKNNSGYAFELTKNQMSESGVLHNVYDLVREV